MANSAATIIVEGDGREAGESRIPASDRRPDPPRIDIASPPGERERPVREHQPLTRERAADPEAEAREAIRAANRRALEAESRANQERARADAVTQSAAQTLLAERKQAIAATIEAAEQAKNAAISKLRAAREAGDFEAEREAIEEQSRATFHLEQAKRDKAALDAEEAQAKQRPADGVPRGPSPAARRWIEEHPLFTTDSRYKHHALAAHNLALESGYVNGSEAYIDFINRELEALYGPGHGVPETHGRSSVRADGGRTTGESGRTSRGPSASYGVPRRGGGSDDDTRLSDGVRYADTPAGRVTWTIGADGRERIAIPNAVRAEWEQFAGYSGMTLAEYAKEQIAIAEEQRAGGTGGLYIDDGSATYR